MWEATSREIVEMAKANGYEGVELWAQQVESCALDMNEWIQACQATNIKTIIHAKSWDLNYASVNEGIRKASIK